MPASAVKLQLDPAEETIHLGPLTLRFLVTGETSSGSVAAFEVTVPAGQRLMAPAHSHDRFEETIYGIAGALTWTVDGQAFTVRPGHTLCIPRGAVHRFDNLSATEDAKVLCVATPAALGPQFFRESAEIINAAAGGPPDRAKVADLMLRFGLTPAAPAPQP